MGTVLLDIGVKIRKGLIFTIRCCFKSVYHHPFLVGFLCFLMFLYRSSPFVFSLLVSASPVLICTAFLLGLILSYGEPNTPEIEIEERKVKFETNGSHFVPRFGEKAEEGFDDTAPLIEKKSNSGEIWEEEEEGENRELIDLKLKTQWVDEKSNDEDLESNADSFDSEKVNVASLDSLPRSPWILIEEGEEEENKVDEEENSGSDSAESSSPDASMTDIMPILDELHPLLDEETSPLQPVSESSSESSDDGNHDDMENDQDYVDDNKEEGEGDTQENKEDPTESAITWTEEDQRNLMDLGSSEVERNQRLENLILKRRSRNNTGTVHERNLIDLESDDYQFDLAPISTRRQNPFDNLNLDSALPLIPGSAPSVLLQRANPFDIPYDSNEEKLDLMGDGFKEEFAAPQSKGAVFRRHGSFNIGNSDVRKLSYVPQVKSTLSISERRDVSISSQASMESINPSVSVALAIDIPVYDSSPRQNDGRIAHEISTTDPTDVVDMRERDVDFSEIEFEPRVQHEVNFQHLDQVQTAVEQVDNIKEIDEDILAELDKVGDFSVQQWGTGLEKTIDSGEENEIEDVVHSDIDIQEEGVECVSEPQLSEASGSQHIEVSRIEFEEPDSPDSKTSEKIEVQSDPMPELEAGKIEDIDLAFKQITAKDMTVDSEPVFEKSEHLNSVDQALHVSESEGIYDVEGKSVEATLPPNDTVLELLKSNSDDESVEVNADEVSTTEIGVASEKLDNEDEVPKASDLIPSVKEKESKKSSSNSSSASSSSDSDKE